MNIQLDAQPETTLAGDIIVTVCLALIFLAAFGLGWTAFELIRAVVS